jgi:hypothetical protein
VVIEDSQFWVLHDGTQLAAHPRTVIKEVTRRSASGQLDYKILGSASSITPRRSGKHQPRSHKACPARARRVPGACDPKVIRDVCPSTDAQQGAAILNATSAANQPSGHAYRRVTGAERCQAVVGGVSDLMVFMAKRDWSLPSPGKAVSCWVMNCSYVERSATATKAW